MNLEQYYGCKIKYLFHSEERANTDGRGENALLRSQSTKLRIPPLKRKLITNDGSAAGRCRTPVCPLDVAAASATHEIA